MKKLKILTILFVVTICTFALCGCGASVDYYYTSSGDTITAEYKVNLPSSVVNAMEKTASSNTTALTGTTWTVRSYFETFGIAFGCATTVNEKNGNTIVTISRTYTPSSDSDTDEDENYDRKIEKHFFTYDVIYTQSSPYNGLRAQYDGTEEIAPGTIMDVLVNGVTDVIPGIKSAFPAIKSYNPSDLTLSFYWNANVTPMNGEIVTINGEKWAKWSVAFDTENHVITYSYSGRNPLGWYVVIFGVGLVTVAIVLLATRKSKSEPKMVELKKGPVHYHVESDGTVHGDDGSIYRDPFAMFMNRTNDSQNPFGTVTDDVERAKRDLEDIFDGHDPEQEEKERLKRRLDELLPPDEAEEAKKKLDDKK